DDLEDMEAYGINLLEFCYPFNNWHEFAARGFKIKNPPYPVMYNYEYAGSLPIEGSEEECLRLVSYALEKNLKLGVHYCSLENKHRSQIQRQNQMIQLEHPCFEMDSSDFFYKTVKAFDSDVKPILDFLERMMGSFSLSSKKRSWYFDPEEKSLQIHPCYLKPLLNAGLHTASGSPITLVTSVNVLEQQGDNVVLRELALERIATI
ncbi:MAG: radical SAM protein, partial [Eggerthellaceae bacterium]|nr:radical SAM protein [Eggerthellaceae bacterium]